MNYGAIGHLVEIVPDSDAAGQTVRDPVAGVTLGTACRRTPSSLKPDFASLILRLRLFGLLR